ncbi:CCAAT-box-binding transcription factor [Cryptosporidium ubiquitum]|uniref:CCAAT-box-binding transcription factor n=1 Tax=Cryptosporidium ubiquitum TaxID=857276 RepID=A0A1J4MEW0_9CRYT|nr:CCAAT-box-binding transcription factor [Cryptosporidium ubiquitum]OII72774.1 CCAAT-box-binding transcription factor [Cryptosporidium ubiquitum]
MNARSGNNKNKMNFKGNMRYKASGNVSSYSNKFGGFNTGKFQVLQVNSTLDNPKEVSKLIKNPWIREFSECVNWQEGGMKLNKFNKLIVNLKPESLSTSKLELREKIISDLMILGSEMLIRIREETFKKITPDKDTVWLRNMSQDVKATLKDRTESCTILIQQNPILYINEMKVLQGILNNATNKTGFLKMIDTILNLLIEGSLFPKSRELSYLQDHEKLIPLIKDQNEITITTFEFVQIYFENFLKEWYLSFTNVLLKMLNDTLWTVRKKIITVIYHLSSIMEQRYSLVNFLVHKFGDKEDKVASHSTFLLGELIKNHRNSQVLSLVLNILSDHISKNLDSFHKSLNLNPKINTINQVIFRHIYRLILFISEIKLSKNYNYFSLDINQINNITNHPPPIKILRLCLSSLKVIVESKTWDFQTKNKNQVSIVKEPLYRLLRVTLNCINRSLPYAEAQIKIVNDQLSNQLLQEFETNYIPKLYYLCHNIQCGSIRIVILNVLYRISKILNILSDRYYRLLYSQLLYKPIYTSKNKKLLVFLIWQIINDQNTNYKVSLSILKRSIQISIHNNDISMLACFLVIIVNVINYNLFNSNSTGNQSKKKHKNIQDDFLINDLETSNIRSLSNTVKELILKSNDAIMNEDEEENFVDIQVEENEMIENNDNNNNNIKSDQIVNYMQKSDVSKQDKYDFTKRDPKYANSESIHFWEFELLKTYYHPLIVELVYKSIVLCEDDGKFMDKDHKKKEYQSIISSITRFLENFKLSNQIKAKSMNIDGEKDNTILKIFDICSLSLFMQILSYNPVDLNLILLKSIEKRSEDNNEGVFKRISNFNKWNNKHIPSYLDFYKIYFQDPMVKAIESYNLNNSDSIGNKGASNIEGNEEDEFDNFEIDYDETSGKMIKSNSKYNKYRQEDLIVDSLVDEFSAVKDCRRDSGGEDEEDEDAFEVDFDVNDEDNDDIDLLDGVNMDDFDELGDDLDDLDDNYDQEDKEDEEDEEDEEDGEDEEGEDDLDLLMDNSKSGIKRRLSTLSKIKGEKKFNMKKLKSSNGKKGLLNTITYVDADEMEEYLK